jgi:general secretion pathway protein A
MFLEHYGLQEQPFGVTPDPRFLYLGSSHREALATLFYGIEADRGFMVLIAHPGFGKTTLIFQLMEKLQPDARTVFLFQTQCNSREMMQYLLNDLGVDVNGMETVAMHNKLNQILTQERQAGRRFVLIVDEAQNLDPSVLETIRLLSNFETSHAKLLQILLVGQPQLARKLASPSLEQLQQRISMFAKLEPFDREDTANYIAHRLKVAGYTGSDLFTSGAMDIIKDQSRGIPRNINRLCFSALSLGYAMSKKKIDADMMREVVADLDVESTERASAHLQLMAPSESVTTVTEDSPVISYPAATAGGSSRWALGIGGVAASLLIALGLVSYSHGKLGRFLPTKAAASTGIQTSTPSAPAPVQATISPSEKTEDVSAAATVSPSPLTAPVQPSADSETGPGDALKIVKVTVRPGETLQQIALRTLGQDDSKLIRQIQELNPGLKNPDHIEADQEIRLPLLAKTTNPAGAPGAN